MTYIESKYNFKFGFSEKSPLYHGSEFGCCGYYEYCGQEGFCVIPESYSDAKGLCSLAKLKGYDKKNIIRIKKGRLRNGEKNVLEKRRKR